MWSLNAFLLGLAILCALAYLIYRSSTPSPLPGIPYLASSVRPFGDTPAIIQHVAKHSQIATFFSVKADEIQSPIAQMFVKPFSRPWVIIADSVTTEEILTRRYREFEVSPEFTDRFRPLVPTGMVVLHTDDERWKKQRRLMADTMSTSFLQNVAAFHSHATCLELIGLWKEEQRLAGDRIVDCREDMRTMMLDAIWATAFGSSIATTQNQKSMLSGIIQLQLASKEKVPIEFPQAKRPEGYDALVTLAQSVEIGQKSPLGEWHHVLALKCLPVYRKAERVKQKMVEERLDAAWLKFTKGSKEEVKSAVDLLVEREVLLAEKENRAPQYKSAVVRDELLSFLLAGNDTSSATLEWAMKFLTKHREWQIKLRDSLQSTFETSTPTSLEVAKANLPLAEATIEEVLRCGGTAPGIFRRTKQDTVVLGCHIPANTDILLLSQSAGYKSPAWPQGPGPNGVWTSEWDPQSLSKFQPERWLKASDEGVRFDPRAGPQHNFGIGLRACFGKKLALISMRVILTLIVLNFELLPLPAEHEDWDAEDVLSHRPQRAYIRLKQL